MKKASTILLFSLLLTVQIQAQTLSPYSLKTGREAVLLGAGVVSYGTAYAINQGLSPLTVLEVQGLSRSNVPRFDQSALNQYSPKAAQLSDLTLGAGIGLTGVVMLSAKAPASARPQRTQPGAAGRSIEPDYSFFKSELFTVGVMYVETMLLTNGVKSTVKNAFERTRPLAYNPAAPLNEKLEKDTQRSFYSGHTANAFATAVFAAEIFRHYHPQSRAKPWVWLGSLGLATGTAYLRYEAGQHFPSDLLVGAAVGSLAGWGIPKLHQNQPRKTRTASLSVTPWSNGLVSGLSFKLSILSPGFAKN